VKTGMWEFLSFFAVVASKIRSTGRLMSICQPQSGLSFFSLRRNGLAMVSLKQAIELRIWARKAFRLEVAPQMLSHQY